MPGDGGFCCIPWFGPIPGEFCIIPLPLFGWPMPIPIPIPMFIPMFMFGFPLEYEQLTTECCGGGGPCMF
jgi:hypothetical protein